MWKDIEAQLIVFFVSIVLFWKCSYHQVVGKWEQSKSDNLGDQIFYGKVHLDSFWLVDSEVPVLNGVNDDDGVCANTELVFPPARSHEV